MSLIPPLTRREMRSVVEGRGAASRVPLIIHFWVNPAAFGERESQVRQVLDRYPCDIMPIWFNMPSIDTAPADDPSYRWSWRDHTANTKALDNAGFVDDWDEDLDRLLNDFPSADYPGLIPSCPADDGRYRVGCWWYFFFERFWSIRGMENALTDFWLYPEAVHALFDRLADFYIRLAERAHDELHVDAIMTSDDLGTQTSTFFSPQVFDEFFAPYYKRVIDRVHQMGMHFWLHTCGNVSSLIPRFIDLGIDVLHPIQKYTMDERVIARQFGDKISIWSGFDVQRIIPYGTPEDVRQEVRYLMDTYYRPDGRFMLTLGNGATPDTPVESLAALLDEATTYVPHSTERKLKIEN